MQEASDIGAKNVVPDIHLKRKSKATKKKYGSWQSGCTQMVSTFVKLVGI